jgi:hypothetical protein
VPFLACRGRAFLAGLLLAGLAVTSVGCVPSARQATVIPQDPANQPGAISALDRGTFRRQALESARAGIAAWVKDDTAGMRSVFSTSQVEFYRKLASDAAASGRKRVRVHARPAFEAIDMSADGQEVVVRYTFVDNSYDADASGKALTAPTGKDTELSLTIDRVGARWLIMRMIGGDQELK